MITESRGVGLNRIYRISGSIPVKNPDLKYACIYFPYFKLLQHKPGLSHMYEHLMTKYGVRNGIMKHLIFINCDIEVTGMRVSFWVRSSIKEAEESVFDMVFNPEFEEEDLSNEKYVLKNEIHDEGYDENCGIDTFGFMERILGLPKGANTCETPEDIDGIKLDDLYILRQRMRDTNHFVIIEYGESDESSVVKESMADFSKCDNINAIESRYLVPENNVSMTSVSKSDVCETFLVWRRDDMDINDLGFIEFYSINMMLGFMNDEEGISFSLLSHLRSKGICYYIQCHDIHWFERVADVIYVSSTEWSDSIAIKNEIFTHFRRIIKNGIDKDEFGYMLDKFKIWLSPGSFESNLNHISFCIKNGIPNDMDVLRFIECFTNDELMDMLIKHIGIYYTENDVNMLGSYKNIG